KAKRRTIQASYGGHQFPLLPEMKATTGVAGFVCSKVNTRDEAPGHLLIQIVDSPGQAVRAGFISDVDGHRSRGRALILSSFQSAISEPLARAWSWLAKPSLWQGARRERVS